MEDINKKNSRLIQENKELKEKISELESTKFDYKDVEKALLESEDRIQTFLISTPLAYQSLNENGYFIEVNNAWCKALGYTREEVIGKNFADFILPEYKEIFEKDFTQFKKAGEIKDAEFEMIKKDTSHITMSINGRVGYLKDSKYKQIHCILHDITEYKIKGKALKVSEGKYQNLTKNAPVAICRILTEDSICDFVNDEFIKQSGYTLEEFNNLSKQEEKNLIHPEDQKRVSEEIDSWIDDGYKGVKNLVYRCFSKNKEIKWLNSFHYADFDIEGKIFAVNQIYIDITERKFVEEALKQSEEKYKSIIENTDDLIMLTKPDGIISYLSPACEKVLGHDPKDLLGQQPWIIHPDDLENVKKIHNKALEGKGGVNIEYRIKTRSDETKWVSHSFSPVFTDDKFQMLVSVIRDFTERKQTEKALKENEERYRRLVEYSPIAIAIHSEGKIRFANESCLKLFGASSPEQIIGKPVMDFVHPDFREIVTKRISSMIRESKYVKPLEEKFLRLDGEIIDVEVAAIPFVYEGKTAIHVVISNITERKHAVDALRDSEEKYRTLIDNNQNGVFIIQDAKMHFVNDAFAKMVGYSTDEIIGMDFKELIAPEDLETVADRYRRRQAGEDVPKEYEFRLLHKDGHTRVFVNMSVGLIEYCGRIASMGTLMDITERKKAEEALKESEKRYRILFESTIDGLFVLDAETKKIVLANHTTAKMYGFDSAEEIVGVNLLDFIHTEDRERALRIIEKDMFEKNLHRIEEFRTIAKNGKELRVSTIGTRIEYQRKLAGLISIRDITEHKQAEIKYINQLKNLLNIGTKMRMELKLENLLQNICDLIVKSLGWRKVILSLRDYNTETSKPVAMAGYDEKTTNDILSKPPTLIKETSKFFIDKFKISNSYYIDHTNWEKLKEYPAEVVVIPIEGSKPEGWNEQDLLLIPIQGKKNILGFISPDNPIDGKQPTKEIVQSLEIFANEAAVAIENARLYEELQSSEKRFKDIAANTGDWIWETDEKGRYTYSSPIVKQILGYDNKEILGKYFYDFFVPEERDELKKPALNVFAKKESFRSFINKNIHKDGHEVILETSGIPIIDSDGKLLGYRGADRDITERIQAQETLRKNEILFRQLFENLPIGIAALDEKGLIQRVNNGFEKIFQYSSEEVLGKDINDVVVPEHLEEESFELSSTTYKGTTVQKESIRKRKDGSIVPVYLYGVPVKYNDKTISIYGIYVDITDRKQAIEALQEREAHLSAILENLPSLIMFIDKNYRILSFNNSLRLGYIQMYGIKLEIGKNLIDSVSEETGKIWENRYDRALKGKKFTIEETININGEDHYFSTSFNPVTTASNETLGVLVISQDITEYYRLSLVARQTTNSIIITDLTRRIQWINEGFTRMTGFTLEESIGKSPKELLQGPNTDSNSNKFMMEKLDTSEGFSLRVFNYKKDKTGFWNELHIDPMYDSSGKQIGFIGIQNDVTDKVNQRIALKEAKEAAEESSKLKSAFLANMSHEIRTPLNGILGFAELLSNELKLSENQDMYTYADSIHKSGRRLLSVINDILDISKIEANKMELSINDCNLENIIERELILFNSIAKLKGIEIKFDSPKKDIISPADENRLGEVTNNIIDNAIKFTEKGSVTISIGFDENKNMNFLSVKDSGIGIDEEYLPFLFQSFTQADISYSKKYDGSGLGLSIAKRLIELMNGSIEVETKKGAGTKIIIFLPVSKHEYRKSEKEKITKQYDSIKGLNKLEDTKVKPNILLIEDDSFSSKVIELLLYKYVNLSTATNGDEALEMIDKKFKQNEFYDLFLMDIRLPKPWNGFSLREEIKKRWNEYFKIPFIAQTAFAMKEDQEKIIQAGFEGYISKPISGSNLTNLIFEKLKKNNK